MALAATLKFREPYDVAKTWGYAFGKDGEVWPLAKLPEGYKIENRFTDPESWFLSEKSLEQALIEIDECRNGRSLVMKGPYRVISTATGPISWA